MDFEKLKDLDIEKFKQVRPSSRYADQMTDFINELRREQRVISAISSPMWLLELEKEFSRAPEGSSRLKGVKLMVRTNDDRVVGLSCIRESENHDVLMQMGGNISYVVRPSERRKGYNKLNLYMTLKECRARHMTSIIMTARSDNRAASRSIRAMGGTFIRSGASLNYPDLQIEEYVLDVQRAIEKFEQIFEFLIDDSDDSEDD